MAKIFWNFQSVVYYAFICRSPASYVIVANIKCPFSVIFSHRPLRPIFFLIMSQGILHTSNSHWNILVLACMQVLAMSAASHYSFVCLHFTFVPVLRLEWQGAKCHKRTCFQGFLVREILHNSWGDTSCSKMHVVKPLILRGAPLFLGRFCACLRVCPSWLNGFIIITHNIWADWLNSDKYSKLQLLIWAKSSGIWLLLLITFFFF